MKKILLVFSLLASLSCSYPQQTLRIAASEGLISFDPHTQDEAVTMEILGNVYESLVAFAMSTIAPGVFTSDRGSNSMTGNH